MSSYEFKTGDIVWAKIAGHPWWPGTIARITPKRNHEYLINFIGENSHASVSKSKMLPFEEFKKKNTSLKDRRLVHSVEQASLINLGQITFEEHVREFDPDVALPKPRKSKKAIIKEAINGSANGPTVVIKKEDGCRSDSASVTRRRKVQKCDQASPKVTRGRAGKKSDRQTISELQLSQHLVSLIRRLITGKVETKDLIITNVGNLVARIRDVYDKRLRDCDHYSEKQREYILEIATLSAQLYRKWRAQLLQECFGDENVKDDLKRPRLFFVEPISHNSCSQLINENSLMSLDFEQFRSRSSQRQQFVSENGSNEFWFYSSDLGSTFSELSSMSRRKSEDSSLNEGDSLIGKSNSVEKCPKSVSNTPTTSSTAPGGMKTEDVLETCSSTEEDDFPKVDVNSIGDLDIKNAQKRKKVCQKLAGVFEKAYVTKKKAQSSAVLIERYFRSLDNDMGKEYENCVLQLYRKVKNYPADRLKKFLSMNYGIKIEA
eukprot:CAMPEP_0115013362 /NCGR_PEP_ID=MMETSP0216-20121206/25359_1 /TAXON_ID=223996 /ORGANISM="Protocruzia adherens, Strain Boccale" /LENGTH=489 /DNA_ID=CAMNT_0002382739 /DNA_START=227 /DNA_END=1696 /DNA_ORIENTATION=+